MFDPVAVALNALAAEPRLDPAFKRGLQEAATFRIERQQSTGMPPLVLARDGDDYVWRPRASDAATFTESEADAVVASFNLDDAVVRGVRNTVESASCQ